MAEKTKRNPMSIAARLLFYVMVITVICGLVGCVGAIHAFLRGYSSIYTAIFLTLAVGNFLAAYVLYPAVVMIRTDYYK